jgi:hypothetical protein
MHPDGRAPLRRGILAVMLGGVLAFTGVAQAQKTVLPGYPSTPPPRSVLPGNPTTPPPMANPDDDDRSVGRGTFDGSRMGTRQPGPGIGREEARGRFQQCVTANTRDGKVSDSGLSGCVSAWMPPAELSRFNACWSDPKTSPWECFGRAYN